MRVLGQDGTYSWQAIKPILDVPILFPRCGAFALTLPLAAGDEVLVHFSSRCIDGWWQNSGLSNQPELRMHDLSDGFAFPGPCSLPNVLGSVSETTAQLRSADGLTYIEIAPGGVVNIVAPGGLNVNGAVVATGEVTGNNITLSTHVHGGIYPGTSDTGPPIG
jgi:hypothetical protein